MTWVYYRDGEVRKVFKNRQEAISYYKKMLNQTLKDFQNQDKNDDYDYPIEIFNQGFREVRDREACLGL